MTHTRLFAILFPLTIALGSLGVGCGDDAGANLPPAECSGSSCTCEARACSCLDGVDCNLDCGAYPCSLTCEVGSKCDTHGERSIDVECLDGADCKVHAGDRSSILCDASLKCEIKAGVESEGRCLNDAECKLELGNDSTASCEDTSSCDIKCNGDCTVTCATNAACKVTCGDTDATVDATECSDGSTLVCGSCPG